LGAAVALSDGVPFVCATVSLWAILLLCENRCGVNLYFSTVHASQERPIAGR
jgi:hypothetical protein